MTTMEPTTLQGWADEYGMTVEEYTASALGEFAIGQRVRARFGSPFNGKVVDGVQVPGTVRDGHPGTLVRVEEEREAFGRWCLGLILVIDFDGIGERRGYSLHMEA